MYEVNVGGVLLPVAPEKIEVKVKSKSETITLIDGAEMDILKSPGLSEISFTVELPGTPGRSYAVYDGGFEPPDYYLSAFERLSTAKQPFLLSIVRNLPNGASLHESTFTASMGDYTITDDSGAGFDTIVKLTFRQYSQKETLTANLTPTLDGGLQVTTTRVRPVPLTAPVIVATMVTAMAGETMWSIAKKYLGDGSKWAQLAKLNGQSGNSVSEGQKIKIK